MTATAPSAADSLVGRTIAGKFRVEAKVGTGSMGAVYRARHTVLQKTVAIKVMNRSCASEKTFASRFKREAKAASRLDHPNSLRVIDFGEDDGLLYMAMEYLDGRNLFTLLKEDWPLEPARVVDLLSQALAALAVAHGMGIVHRDLKPENIMVLRGEDDEGNAVETVKVCDFGIAKFLAVPAPEDKGEYTQTMTGTGTLTAAGMLLGTPEYMSPEQVSGDELDARSDLYSLGVILYQMLTGRLPFEGRTPINVALKHTQERPKPPSVFVPEVDAHLEAVCLRALSKRREERYQTAREMRLDLRAAVGAKDSAPMRARSAKISLPDAAARSRGDAFSSADTLAAGEDAPAPTTTQPDVRALQERRRTQRLAAAIALVVVLAIALVAALVR